MFFIFLYIIVLAVVVQSILRTDCYVSFSNPAIYIKISHYYPSGPIYLFASFTAYRDLHINGRRSENDHIGLHFKRFDDKCTPSILFSTLGTDFKKLSISIFLLLQLPGDSFAHFKYDFFKGFKPGIYEMFDQNQNFMIHTQIKDDEKSYLKVLERLGVIGRSYVNSINGTNNEICVITENNRVVILKPNYDDVAPYGFITHLWADLYINGEKITSITYPSFECIKSETYSEDKLMFIVDGNDYRVSFSVTDTHDKEKKFKLFYQKLYYVKNLKNIPRGYKRLFLMKYKIDSITCPDRSKPIFYLSRCNTVYYVKVFQRICISSLVKFSGQLTRSPFDICGLKNEDK